MLNQPVSRPASVWITQVILAIWAIALMYSCSKWVSRLFRCFSGEPFLSCTSSLTTYQFLIGLLMLIATFLAFWGLQKRSPYGKWLAVSFLIAATVIFMAGQQPLHGALRLIFQATIHGQPLPNPLRECNHPFGNLTYFCGYQSYQALALKVVFDTLPSLLLGFLAFRLLFSQAVKRFFHSSTPD